MIPDTPKTLLRKIAEYANGDDAAEWARFVELYTPVIRAFICAREDVNESDADDVVQEIFVRLVNVLRAGTYRPEKGRFRVYLGTMVRHLLIDRHRRALRRQMWRSTSTGIWPRHVMPPPWSMSFRVRCWTPAR